MTGAFVCFFDSRGILQRPFWEQSRERGHNSRLATIASQHLSRRNASGYRLCAVAMTSQWRTLALAQQNQIPSGLILLRYPFRQSPSMDFCSQLSSAFS